MTITISASITLCYAATMTRKSDARDQAIAAAVRLFKVQGYTATGLNQILAESGAPKGSFYFHFPRGKAQLAEEAIDWYVTSRTTALRLISEQTSGDAARFVSCLFEAFAEEMVATGFQYGCLMQNLGNELPALDPVLTDRIARGFSLSTEIIASHFRDCGCDPERAASAATALVAALEGARTVARLERTPAVFRALAEVTSVRWTPSLPTT